MKIRLYLLTTYLFISSCLLGWQFWAFTATFYPANEQAIAENFPIYMSDFLLYFLPLWTITFLTGLVIYTGNKNQLPIDHLSYRKHFFLIGSYYIFLLLNFSLYKLNFHFYVYELLGIIIVLGSIYLAGFIFLNSDHPEFHHPTTNGGIVVTSALAGLSCFILFSDLADKVQFQTTWLLILLLFDMLIVFARFRFLSAFNQITNQAAKQLLGKYIFIFGARIILGIFTPLVFLLYTMISDFNAFRGIAVLILLGGLINFFLIVVNVRYEEVIT